MTRVKLQDNFNRRRIVRGYQQAHFRGLVASALAAVAGAGTKASFAQKKYSDGVSDTEIKLGHTGPYSGPASAYGTIGKGIEAYWKMVNDQGGINGRKINFITYDDGFSPPKTVEMVRKLVENDKVFATFQTLGTACNTAIRKFMNQKKVPQLFVSTGASKWGNPKQFPWTIGWQPDYVTESGIYAKHILAQHKGEKIGVLWLNDDSGKDYVSGFMKGLGKENEKLVAATVSYEVTDPTVDSQIIQLKSSGATVFFCHATPKHASQAIRKAAELGWKPAFYLVNVSISVDSVLKPAGLENCQGIITAAYYKDPTDPQWANTPDFVEWKAWMAKYLPAANAGDAFYTYAYAVSATMRDAEAVRQRADAGKPDEAGCRHEGPRCAAAAAGHQAQHQPDGLLSHPVHAASALRGRYLEAVRRGGFQRRQLAAAGERLDVGLAAAAVIDGALALHRDEVAGAAGFHDLAAEGQVLCLAGLDRAHGGQHAVGRERSRPAASRPSCTSRGGTGRRA